MKEETLYIVMPAYNEEENIEKVLVDWYPKLLLCSEDSRIVIADSGSQDRTHEILLSMKNKGYPKLEILSETNQYHGPKVISLYDFAIKQGADYIFQTDSDGQTNPDEFDGFWQIREQFDGIFGNRISRGDGKVRDLVEKVVCLLLRLYFGINVPDANAPFRLMKASVLEKYLHRMPEDYNLPNIIITTFFVKYNEKSIFKEISFKPRQVGKNYINKRRIINIGWKALGDFARFRREMNEKV